MQLLYSPCANCEHNRTLNTVSCHSRFISFPLSIYMKPEGCNGVDVCKVFVAWIHEWSEKHYRTYKKKSNLCTCCWPPPLEGTLQKAEPKILRAQPTHHHSQATFSYAVLHWRSSQAPVRVFTVGLKATAVCFCPLFWRAPSPSDAIFKVQAGEREWVDTGKGGTGEVMGE